MLIRFKKEIILSVGILSFFQSCATFDTKDEYGLLVDDYTKSISNNGVLPAEPEWMSNHKPETKHELHEVFFRRGKLYGRQRVISDDANSLAYADFNRAIELAGNKAPPHYFDARAYAGSERALGKNKTISLTNYGTYLHIRDKPANPQALPDVIADFTQTMAVTTDPFRLIDLYICRGQLYYLQGNYIRAIDDFNVVERLLSTTRSSIENNYEVWSALDYTYDRLIEQAKTSNNSQYVAYLEQRRQVSQKVSYWRDLRLDEYKRLETLRLESETKRKNEKAAECMEKAKLARAHAKTCGHCNGSGKVMNYSAGTGNYQSSASIENGKMKWMEQKGQDSSWGPGVCPICYGKGVVLPRIEGCDPRYLN